MMVVENISIEGTKSFNKFKDFIETGLSNASFRTNTVHCNQTDSYEVSVRYSLSDAILVNQFHTKLKETYTKNEDGKSLKEPNTFSKVLSKLSFLPI